MIRTSSGRSPGFLLVEDAGRLVPVAHDEILWMEAAGHRSWVHTEAGRYACGMGLRAVAAQLPEGRFARVHRSALVQLSRIVEVRPKSHGDSVLRLSNGHHLTVTRQHRVSLQRQLGLGR